MAVTYDEAEDQIVRVTEAARSRPPARQLAPAAGDWWSEPLPLAA